MTDVLADWLATPRTGARHWPAADGPDPEPYGDDDRDWSDNRDWSYPIDWQGRLR